MQVPKTIFWGVLLTVCSAGASLAQPKSPPAKPIPASPNLSEIQVATTSSYLLSSPAAKAQLQREWLISSRANSLTKAGSEAAMHGDWQGAEEQYQQALELLPKSRLALYGMAECSQAIGDTTKAINYSRQAIYRDGAAASGFYENDTARLMQFALLLNKAGQTAEALSAYNRAAYALDYQDSQYNGGRPHLKALLPELTFGLARPNQVQFTPQHLQALAETALAHEELGFGSNEDAQAHVKEAVKLYPESSITNYYLGEVLLTRDRAGARVAYAKAAQLGDETTRAAAKERITQLP